ncbi:MAG: exodeoxyribonuclease V subunit alpha [Desulfovermiculus sp.]
MWQTLESLRSHDVLSDIDIELARLLAEQDPQVDWEVVLGACLASRAPQHGDTCIHLRKWAGQPLLEDNELEAIAPSLEKWRKALASSDLVGEPGVFRPMILEQDRLYLQRYWAYERDIAEDLPLRAEKLVADVDIAVLKASLDRLFTPSQQDGADHQKLAAAMAVLRRLTMVAGGPGTGKTTTIARLLAALLEQPGSEMARIALAAPTGKAAARLQDSIRRAKRELPVSPEIRDRIPETARTLHRLLGARTTSIYFRYNRDRPLPFDLVVLDEASMVDMALFAKLLQAVPSNARLVIVGDRDQLAPVEAGAVLREIPAHDRRFSQQFGDMLAEVTGDVIPTSSEAKALDDSLIELHHAHRFSEGGLNVLVEAVKAGDAASAQEVLIREEYPAVHWQALPSTDEEKIHFVRELVEGFSPLLKVAISADSQAAFTAYRSFGVIDALRQGPMGSEALNMHIETELRRQGRIPSHGFWYPGRPVLVTQNDYRLGLFNGDVGIALPDGGKLKVCFETVGGDYYSLSPSRLPAFETAYVVTIHKSQGSEMEKVRLLIPESTKDLNSRELIYTGTSRAQQSLTVYCNQSTLKQAIATTMRKSSGLNSKL